MIFGTVVAAIGACIAFGAPSQSDLFRTLYADPLSRESDWYLFDSATGLLNRPGFHRRVVFPEISAGFLDLDTNNLGFREDRPTLALKEPGMRRVLVVGDSHTYGVVANRDSYPHLIEARLNATNEKRAWEVLNGGVGHYSFQNYLGFLRRYRYLKPDAVIVAIYSGNDFMEAAEYLELKDGRTHDKAYLQMLERAETLDSGAIWQGLNQAIYFKHAPKMRAEVLRFAEKELLEMRSICRRDAIPLFVILLPTKLDIEWNSDRSRLDRVKGLLELSNSDLGINAELRVELVRRLQRKGFLLWDAAVDPPSPVSARPLFWSADYHLSQEGHRWIANGFLRKYEDALNSKAASR